MLMNVPEDWTTVVVILNVLTLMGVFYADVTMVIPEMVYIAMVSSSAGLCILPSNTHKFCFNLKRITLPH